MTNRIALGGHSYGANLALSTAMILRDSDNEKEHHVIRTLYLISGLLSPNLNTTSMNMFGQGDYGLSYEFANWTLNQIFQNVSDYYNSSAFPLLKKNFTGLPPVYIAAMALDPVRDHSIELANRLLEAGSNMSQKCPWSVPSIFLYL